MTHDVLLEAKLAELVHALAQHWPSLPPPLQAWIKDYLRTPDSLYYNLLRLVHRHYLASHSRARSCGFCAWWEAQELYHKLTRAEPPLDIRTSGVRDWPHEWSSFQELVTRIEKALEQGYGVKRDDPT